MPLGPPPPPMDPSAFKVPEVGTDSEEILKVVRKILQQARESPLDEEQRITAIFEAGCFMLGEEMKWDRVSIAMWLGEAYLEYTLSCLAAMSLAKNQGKIE